MKEKNTGSKYNTSMIGSIQVEAYCLSEVKFYSSTNRDKWKN